MQSENKSRKKSERAATREANRIERMEELNNFIGKIGTLKAGNFPISVTIQGARHSYGRIDLFVSSDGYEGEWVQADRVEFAEEPQAE